MWLQLIYVKKKSQIQLTVGKIKSHKLWWHDQKLWSASKHVTDYPVKISCHDEATTQLFFGSYGNWTEEVN